MNQPISLKEIKIEESHDIGVNQVHFSSN